MAILIDYANAPGVPGSPPPSWPEGSRIVRAPGIPTLLMIVHPHCPCSRASIGELARLMTYEQGKVTAYVLFVRPQGVDDEWVETDLWGSAAAIPGATVIRDERGVEAARFGATTSGQTVLYDADNRLRFSGGITAARGHSGDNAGRTAIEALLTTGAADRTQTAVFGCPLLAESIAQPEEVPECRQ